MDRQVRDQRASITTGTHYEQLPNRDFDIYDKREQIRTHMLKRFGTPNIKTFDGKDMEELYNMYNTLSFDGNLGQLLCQKKRSLKFNTRLQSASTAGLHSYDDGNHTIKLSVHIISNLFDKGETVIKSNGLNVYDKLDAMMNIFEHELIHLYCSLRGLSRKIKSGPGKMYYSPHGKLFQALVFRYFGHTEFRHNFGQGDAVDMLTKNQCSTGMAIYFDNKSGTRVYGEIEKVNKVRCKINTETQGVYDVPFAMLKIADRDVNVTKRTELDLLSIKSKYMVSSLVTFKVKGGETVSGEIIKMNPKKARVQVGSSTYSVPYQQLI